MKVLSRRTSRTRTILVLAPLVLIIIFMIATSGMFSGSASATMYTLPPLPPPVPGFTPAPVPGPGSFTEIIIVSEADVLLANNANHGNVVAPNVHFIDVRSSFEYLADVCPMQIALGLPLYTVTNTGHPAWNWPDGTHEEAYSNPYWIGFHWNGVPYASLWNIRMQENPNYRDYLNALVADGSIKKNDELVFVCQTGYRASWAAQVAASLGFTNTKVLYGGMLAWEDDWYADDSLYHDNLPTDISPGDCPADGPYTGQNCDPDNVPGPAARPKATVLTAPWKYETSRMSLVGAPVVWNGTEPHVGVKPEWLPGDFALSVNNTGAIWASYVDYLARLLSVDFNMTNNAPGSPGPLNYSASCGGAPAPVGSCEQVYQAAHATAFNTQIVQAPATNGVAATGLPAMAGNINAGTAGIVTIRFNVPPGVVLFNTNVFAMATDVPDPTAVYGSGMEWYGTYQYPGPAPTV